MTECQLKKNSSQDGGGSHGWRVLLGVRLPTLGFSPHTSHLSILGFLVHSVQRVPKPLILNLLRHPCVARGPGSVSPATAPSETVCTSVIVSMHGR